METKENVTKQRKFTWGHGISLAILLFVAATSSMVAYIVSLDYHLVSENHYEEAVQYQSQIDRIEQTNAMSESVLISFNRKKNVIQVEFPKGSFNSINSGTIKLYRPDDAGKDRTYNLAFEKGNIQLIDAKNLQKGRWYVKVRWDARDKGYYKEQSIFI